MCVCVCVRARVCVWACTLACTHASGEKEEKEREAPLYSDEQLCGFQLVAALNSSAMNIPQLCFDGHVYVFLCRVLEAGLLVTGWMWV